MVKRERRTATAASVIATGLIAFSTTAAAHGKLERTTPANGATLSALPAAFAIRFDTPHRVTMLQVSGNGDSVRLTAGSGLEPATEVTAPSPNLAPGEYRLEWRALAPDGHAVKGETSFIYAPE